MPASTRTAGTRNSSRTWCGGAPRRCRRSRRPPSTPRICWAGAIWLERADQIAPAQQIRGVDGCRLDRLQRRGAPPHHVRELFRVPAVRVDAGIGAVGDLHARLHRLLEVLTLLAAHEPFFVDDLLGEAEARVLGDDVIVVVDVGDEVGAMLLHETDAFVVDQTAMLD